MANGKPVTLDEIASRLGMHKSNARKFIVARGFEWIRVRGSSGQSRLALSTDDAEKVLRLREEQGYGVDGSGGTIQVPETSGFFYVIQLIPELDTRRVKLGFARDVAQRLGTHRCTCPGAVAVKTWRCQFAWEVCAMDSVTREGCRRLGGEVFEVDDLEALLARAEQFFSIMPTVGE